MLFEILIRSAAFIFNFAKKKFKKNQNEILKHQNLLFDFLGLEPLLADIYKNITTFIALVTTVLLGQFNS